jgi:serine/threonine protein phosphatase 1
MITCAIGDIHGMADKLKDLLAKIEHWHLAHDTIGSYQLVFLGDYIDRGPASREVLDIVRALEAKGAVCLKGNHEALMVASLNDEPSRRHFLANGGDTTLASLEDIGTFMEAADWMARLPLSFADEYRFFVHAGIRPGVSLAQQSEEDLLWIREPFLEHLGPFPKYIVHGHSPTLRLPGQSMQPQVLRHRCNLDTGAVYGGHLSAAVFTSERVGPVAVISV